MRKLRVILADDEPAGRGILADMLSQFEDSVDIVEVCADGPAAIKAISRHRPDVAFLDINMPQVTGFDVVSALDSDMLPIIVFVTAHDEYAIRAFQAHALDYLLKPVSLQRLQETLNRVRKSVAEKEAARYALRLNTMLAELAECTSEHSRKNARLAITDGGRSRYLPLDSIFWIEAADYYVLIHTTTGSFLHRERMKKIEELLPQQQFFRIHNSSIVNAAHIKEVFTRPGGDQSLRLTNGTTLNISRSRKAAFTTFRKQHL